MQILLANKAILVRRTYSHPIWRSDEGNACFVNHSFRINCRNGISRESGLLDINVIVNLEQNKQPKTSVVIDDSGGLIAFICNQSGVKPEDLCTKINLSVNVATDDNILLDFADCNLGRFDRLNFASGSLCDLSFNASLLQNCTWESVWWLMSLPTTKFKITVKLSVTTDLIASMNFLKVIDPPRDPNLKLGDASADIFIQTLEGLSITCHKSILTGNSEVFDRALNGGFQETKKSNIKMAFSFNAVETLLTFLYTGNFQDPHQCFQDTSLLELLHASHYYHIPGLWDKLCKHLLENLNWETYTVHGCLEIFEFLVLLEHEKKIDHLAKKLVEVVSIKVELHGIQGFKSMTELCSFFESNKQDVIEAWTRFSQIVIKEKCS